MDDSGVLELDEQELWVIHDFTFRENSAVECELLESIESALLTMKLEKLQSASIPVTIPVINCILDRVPARLGNVTRNLLIKCMKLKWELSHGLKLLDDDPEASTQNLTRLMELLDTRKRKPSKKKKNVEATTAAPSEPSQV